jgi:flagellar basal-body rod protein FlgG
MALIRSLNTAEKAMQMQQVRIDALANNLANVNSTGFRGILTRVAEVGSVPGAEDLDEGLVQPQLEEARQRPVAGNEAANWRPVNPIELYHATDTRGGPVTATGRDTDVALLGRGFFSIQTDAGERYTRGGSFTVNDRRELTTPDGNVVLGTGGPIVMGGENFSIENDGRVLVDGAVVGQFKIVDFADPTRLEHEGGNLLKAPDAMEAQPVPAAEIVTAQGHLEGSNVNPIDTLVAMIEAQRAFEVQSKVMNTEDEMLQKSVNNLPRVSS